MVLGVRRRQGAGMGRVACTVAGLAVAMVLWLVAVSPAVAQATLNDSLAKRMQGDKQSRLLVEAKELVYDNDKNIVSARGDVELNYQGRTLQADRVIYDRNTGRVYAEGNARLTEPTGNVVTGDKFELSDDFKNGFINSLRVEQTTIDRGTPVKTRFSAPRAERSEGETTVFERGTYTACEPCKEHPEKPPLWQIKAARIIHNNTEKTIYYENATLEVGGIPVAYLPYFWSPDPTEKRRTGFLAPHYIASSSLGTGVALPFFWAIEPNYDLTLTPTYLSQQGLLAQAEWRHRLSNGAYNVRVAGIDQQDKSAFLPSPLGARERDLRGSIESNGRFYINERWQTGWDFALLSDKYFLQNYRIRSESVGSLYSGFRESISTVYLQGQGDRSWFDTRGYYFKGLSSSDWQKQQPLVHPVTDYNKRIDGPAPIGGEIGIDVNLTSLTREAAQFQGIGKNQTATFFPTVNGVVTPLYETCTVFQRGQCLVRGISGTTSRASAEVSWRRQFVDPLGQVWTPFAYARGDVFAPSPDFSNYQNPQLANFIGGNDNIVGRAMPAVGLEYRYPFVGTLGAWGTQQVEPIAQVIARPNEARIGRLPNEDAQTLVFDDTSLFEWDKFTGYDRVEGGVRANVGAQYSITGGNGFYANALFGQSFQIAGRNSFRVGDLVNTGLDSGLDSKRSDYVGRVQVSPNQNLSFFTRGRFDRDDFSLHRFEAGLSGTFNPLLPLSTNIMYARYEAQPNLGLDRRREGLLTSTTYNLTPHWSFTGSLLFDLDRYLNARDVFIASYIANPETAVYHRQDIWTPTSTSLGLGYSDECATFSLTYTQTPRQIQLASGEKEAGRTVLLRLELRTLGQTNLKQNIGVAAATNQDGIFTR